MRTHGRKPRLTRLPMYFVCDVARFAVGLFSYAWDRLCCQARLRHFTHHHLRRNDGRSCVRATVFVLVTAVAISRRSSSLKNPWQLVRIAFSLVCPEVSHRIENDEEARIFSTLCGLLKQNLRAAAGTIRSRQIYCAPNMPARVNCELSLPLD